MFVERIFHVFINDRRLSCEGVKSFPNERDSFGRRDEMIFLARRRDFLRGKLPVKRVGDLRDSEVITIVGNVLKSNLYLRVVQIFNRPNAFRRWLKQRDNICCVSSVQKWECQKDEELEVRNETAWDEDLIRFPVSISVLTLRVEQTQKFIISSRFILTMMIRLDVTFDCRKGSIWHNAATVDSTESVNLLCGAFSLPSMTTFSELDAMWRRMVLMDTRIKHENQTFALKGRV